MTARVPSQVPEWLLFALTVFGPFAFGCVEPWSRATLEILSFLLALSCFLRGCRDLPPMASWFWLIAAFFAVFGVLQSLTPTAPNFPWPAVPFTVAVHATRGAVLLWAAYAALLWSVPQVIVTHEAARRYCRLLFGLGMALAAQGMLQAATGGGKLYWLRPTAIPGLFGPYYNRDHAANFLLMSMAIGIGVFFSKMNRWPAVDGPSRGDVHALVRLAAGVALLFAGVVACGSRGALLAIPLACALVGLAGAGFARRARARRFRLVAALAVAVFAVYFTYRHVGAGAAAGTLTDRSITERFFIYADSWDWLRDSPLFGTGLGSFEMVYPSYQDFDLTGIADHAHSDWLELFLETGLAGLLVALTAAALLSVSSARAWLAAGSREMRALIAGALGAVAAFAFHSFFEFSFQIPGNAVIFLGIVGFLLSAPLWKDKASPRVRPDSPPAWAATAALVCFLGLARAAAHPVADADPGRIRRLAAVLYDGARADDKFDVSDLRTALRLSLAAAELRPFDYKALELAGTILARLGRASDAGIFRERARLVGFTPVVVGKGDHRGHNEARQIEKLRSLGLLPRRREQK
jgi:O-antigen ligase